jgi:hypothetical protein
MLNKQKAQASLPKNESKIMKYFKIKKLKSTGQILRT